MTRPTAHAVAVLLGTTLIAGAGPASLATRRGPLSSESAGSLTVTVRYQGNGAVDDTHRIWVWLFETPDMGSGAMPLREASIEANGRDVTFQGISEPQVWIAVAYDQQGGFGGSAAPPTGSPVGIYHADGTGPSPIRASDDTAVTVTFSDAIRMP